MEEAVKERNRESCARVAEDACIDIVCSTNQTRRGVSFQTRRVCGVG